MQLSAIPLLGFLVACGGGGLATVDATPPSADASTAPSLSVAATPDTIAPGGTVSIAITTANFTIIDPRSGPPPMPGEGHFHYYVDDAPDYVAGWSRSVNIRTAPTVSPGVHTVRFVLASNAHVEITPIVEATATFTVQ